MARPVSQHRIDQIPIELEKLLGRPVSLTTRQKAGSWVQRLLARGQTSEAITRFLCAVDADDPEACVAAAPAEPRVSRTKASRAAATDFFPAEPEIRLTKPRDAQGRSNLTHFLAERQEAPAAPRRTTPVEGTALFPPSARAAPVPKSEAGSLRAAPGSLPARGVPRVWLGYERNSRGVDESKRIWWEPDQEQNGHLLALGGSGSGKTELLRVLLAGIAAARVPSLVLDFHGDVVVAGQIGYQLSGTPVDQVGINPLELYSQEVVDGGPARQKTALVEAIVRASKGIGHVQKGDLGEAILEAYKRAGITQEQSTWRRPAPTLAVVLTVLEEWLKGKAKPVNSLRGLIAAVAEAFGDPVFAKQPYLSLGQLLLRGVRLNLSALTRSTQILIVDTILRQVFAALKSQGIASGPSKFRLFTVIDEASLLKGAEILDILIKEARKFGLGLILASQEAEDFTSGVRSNAATLIVLKTNLAREAAANARQLRGLTPQDVLTLSGPGDGYIRDHVGTRRMQVVPLDFAGRTRGPEPMQQALTARQPLKTAAGEAGASAKRQSSQPTTPARLRRPEGSRPYSAVTKTDAPSRALVAGPACPPTNPACKLGLLGGVCGLPASLVLSGVGGTPQRQLARYCLTSASKIIASHDPQTMRRRKDYPAEVQERRYESSRAEQLKVQRIASDLNPELIFNTSPEVLSGTPVVSEEGVALGGNGRSMALQLHYSTGATAARDFLREHAGLFGFTADQVDQVVDPVVVRVLDTQTQGLGIEAKKRRLQQLVRLLNVSLGHDMDAKTSAVALARQLDDQVLAVLGAALEDDTSLPEYLGSRQSRDLAHQLRRVGILTEQNQERYLAEGVFTDEGKRLVEKTLAAALLPDAALLEALGEQLNATLARGAPVILAAGRNGPEWDLRPALAAVARDLLSYKRGGGKSLGEFMRQGALLASEALQSDKFPGGRDLLQVLQELADSPLKFSKFARLYLNDARQNSREQSALFATEVITPQEAIRRAGVRAGVVFASS